MTTRARQTIRARSAALALAAVTLLASANVCAQPADASDADKKVAVDGYKAGRAAFEASNFTQALQEFERSNAAVSSPNTKLMIARCHVELGDPAQGYAAYTATIEEARALAVSKYEPATQAAEAERAALASKVSMLDVSVQGEGGNLLRKNNNLQIKYGNLKAKTNSWPA